MYLSIYVVQKVIQTVKNTIWNTDGTEQYKYEYPLDESGEPMKNVKVSPYDQEHIDLITAIRTGEYVNEAEFTAKSNLTAIMGRISAYTGKKVTWDEMMSSDLKIGPETIGHGTGRHGSHHTNTWRSPCRGVGFLQTGS